MFGRILRQWQRDGIGWRAHGISVSVIVIARSEATKQSSFRVAKLYCFAALAMTVLNMGYARTLNLAARNSDGLSGDGGGALAAQPKHGIGDFGRRHEAALRIMPGKLGYRLRMAAARLLHDVVDAAGEQIGIGEPRAYRVDRHVGAGQLERQRAHKTHDRVFRRAIGADIAIAL